KRLRAGFALAPARVSGLLSLNIEVPQGGVQREFESLGGEARIDIRLLDLDLFRRLRFIVWIAVVLLLIGVWLRSRRAYRLALIAAIGLTLLVPVLFRGPWVAFFNTAFQGALFSLAAPIGAAFVRRLSPRNAKGLAFWALVFGALSAANTTHAVDAVSGPFRLERTEAASSRGGPPAGATRILVPYAEGESPESLRDPLGFMGREEFTRLWNLTHPGQAWGPSPRPFVAELRLDGALTSGSLTIHGNLAVSAVNPADTPATVSLALAGLALNESATSSPGAAIKPSGDGLELQMAPHWAGSLRAPFDLRCETTGAAGKVRLIFPEVAAGQWRIELPYARATAAGNCIVENKNGRVALVGAVRPGAAEIAWTGEAAAVRSQGAAAEWRAEIDTQASWDTLATAEWKTRARLNAAAGSELPPEAVFAKDPSLRIVSASGDQLLGATVSDSEVRLRLAKASSASISLAGFFIAEGAASAAPDSALNWVVPALRPPKGVRAAQSLRLAISNQIEILSLDDNGLERLGASELSGGVDEVDGVDRVDKVDETSKANQSTKSTMSMKSMSSTEPTEPAKRSRSGAQSIRSYKTDAADWRLALSLRRLRPLFDVDIAEVFAFGDGLLREAAAAQLQPREGALSECQLTLPRGLRVASMTSGGPDGASARLVGASACLVGWVQSGSIVYADFNPPLQAPARLEWTASADLPASDTALTIEPAGIRG
ncbi:MAG: hypothetical protein NTW86_28935, partial [Candidatus Sumerlaeota bacterium]|nr:hypothetical protein [Candidatus Sumerlaeota bacterium]